MNNKLSKITITVHKPIEPHARDYIFRYAEDKDNMDRSENITIEICQIEVT